MKEIKYYFDHNTLSYKEVKESAKQRLLRLFVFALKGGAIMLVLLIILSYFNISPKVKILQKENQLLVGKYHEVMGDLENVVTVYQKIQNREDKCYRVFGQLEPNPVSIKDAGFGGIDQYSYLQGIASADIIVEALKKTDIVLKKLGVQLNSINHVFSTVREKEKEIASTPGIQPLNYSDLRRISDVFGMRYHPIYGSRRMHYGIDFAAEIGADVFSPGDGTVVFTGFKNGFGLCIFINHGFGITSIYGHLDKIRVESGQEVKRGQHIGDVGNTGTSTGPHLHYEIRVNDKPVNPANYYINDLTPDEYLKVVELASAK